jgi:lysophospholipase L1-like esterase
MRIANRVTRCVVSAFIVTLVSLATSLPAQTAPNGLRKSDFVAIAGDSITQQRRYSALVEVYLVACQPTTVRTFQFGWSGDVVANINARIENDVLRFKPDVVTTCYGMNDGAYRAYEPERAETYRTGLRQLVKTLKAGGARRIIVGSPGAVDITTFKRTEPAIYNDTLKKFGEIGQAIAKEEGVEFADLHTPMMQAQTTAKAELGTDFTIGNPDGFHPNWAGALPMAYAFIKALVGSNEIGTITVDLSANTATGTEGHTVKSMNGGRVELQSTRYVFCYFDDPNPPGGTRKIAPFVPLNDELNRFMLVVKNAPAKAKVTWGKASREFTADELSRGVNLADAFIDDNPFVDPFMTVFRAIEAKQKFEVPMIKSFVSPLPAIQNALPETKPDLDKILKTFQTKHDALETDVAKAMKPVTHVIQIEAVN